MGRRFINETETVDRTTGEVLTTSKTYKIKVDNADEFYMSFVNFMQPIFRIKSITDVQVLAKFCMMMEYGTNKVFLPTGRRKELCEELKINNPNLSRSIASLKELELITGESGMYEVNPAVYWKGNSIDRVRLIKDRTLNIVFTDKDEPEFKQQDNEVQKETSSN